MSGAGDIRVILFDLGGVLLRLRDADSHFGVGTSGTAFLETWVHAGAVREFESGRVDSDEFATRIVRDLALPYDAGEFLQRFDAWPVALYPGVSDLLQQLSVRYRCALLSNTNALHWGRDDIAGVLASRLDRLFLSFETGILKPDRAAFDQVIEHYDCRPREILFFDDTPSNIAAATAAGIQARLIGADHTVRQALSDCGVTA